MFSPGSIIFNALTDHTTIPPGTPTGAFNGTSVNATKVQLGQPVGTVGDPAALIGDVEIPDPGGNSVFFGKNDGVSDVVGINASEGISIDNAAGAGILIFSFGLNWEIFTQDANTMIMLWGSPASQFVFDKPSGVLTWTGPAFYLTGGLGAGIRKPASAAVINVVKGDYTIIVDTTGGNCVVNINPATVPGQLINIKKSSADVNTITITPTSGTIQGFGAPAATYVFNLQGESISIHNDGTNFFII
jgi:hypothetical protein